ncbi:MAG: hypothetical protein JXR76_13590 [Deltaproteobacteria bacterium]|nr:hypothetical protein [Deltaproteobacteria bacterium]
MNSDDAKHFLELLTDFTINDAHDEAAENRINNMIAAIEIETGQWRGQPLTLASIAAIKNESTG